MKHSVLILFLTASTSALIAQTPAKPAAPAAAAAHPAATAPLVKLPPGVPRVKAIVKTAFVLRYQDIKIGTGADGEPGKMFHVLYTGWLGNNGRPDDGHEFDSSEEHRQPVRDKDGKPVMGEDGKPKLNDPQPMPFPQGMGRLIPGFDQGVSGMKIGGKRRIFIPWQLAYGAKGRPGPDAAHPGIPPKSDLIFDVELVEVTDLPAPPTRPGMGGMPPGRPMPPGTMPHPGGPGSGAPGATPVPPQTPGTAPAAGTAPAPGTAPASAAQPAPTAPAAPPTAPAPAPAAPATAPTPQTPPQPQVH